MDHIDNGVWVSGITEVRNTPDLSRFNLICTTCESNISDIVPSTVIYEQYPLADGNFTGLGGVCTYDLFETICDSILQQKSPVLIHCHMGQSRSVAVAATILAIQNNSTWDDEYQNISEQRTDVWVENSLEEFGKQYVSEHSP